MAEGTIVYCSREDHIPPIFANMLGTLLQQHPDAKPLHMISNDIAEARNMAVMNAEGDWIWMIDTDMAFAPTILKKLLSYNVDVVQPLVVKRHPPHEPIFYSMEGTGAALKGQFPDGLPGLVEVPSLGAGGTLYRRKVFEGISGPWFEGIIGKEDTNFALKCRLAGFHLYTDTSTTCGHLTPMLIWPVYQDGQWLIRYDAMNGQSVTFAPNETRRIIPATKLP